ncbi:MAG: hypothetical protein HYV90_04125 [Candidatus Woesebacteria bacterium]|nr:MAG: hypothetical protein HYV90_04125 [Candidatus Woesebacteria bacterium]
MSHEMREIGKARHELATKTPKYIQRCELSEDGESLIYDYMGSTEFEIGDQAKSLNRIFASGITEYTVNVPYGEDNIIFGLVAGKGFPAEKYVEVIKGLIDRSFYLKEPTYLDHAIDKNFNPSAFKIQDEFLPHTNAWFDFTNDVLFTMDADVAANLKPRLEQIKIKWETPEPKHIKMFKKETQKVEQALIDRGVSFIFLGNYADIDGVPHAWLNSTESYGWFTLEELRAWSGKGEVKRIEKRKSGS